MDQKVAVVTGESSGIGRETARSLARSGVKVYGFSRRNTDDPDIRHISVDVSDELCVNRAVSEVLELEGHIDILVCCAGFGISGAAEFTDLSDAKRQIDVNFFGSFICTKAVLPAMRRQGSGRIVLTSSVAGPVPIPFQAFYSASKAAINSYAMSLANEVRPYGISVCAVQPGDIASGFTDARNKSFEGDKEYGGRISASVKVMEHDERTGMKPSEAGQYIAGLALRPKVKPLYAIGFKYKFFCALMKALPCRLSNYLIGMIYAK